MIFNSLCVRCLYHGIPAEDYICPGCSYKTEYVFGINPKISSGFRLGSFFFLLLESEFKSLLVSNS